MRTWTSQRWPRRSSSFSRLRGTFRGNGESNQNVTTFIRLLAVFTFLLAGFTFAPFLDPSKPELPGVAAVPQRVRILGYERDLVFGGWQPGVREAVVEAAGDVDPYSGEPLDTSTAEVDHILPLSAAWDLGAHSWSALERINFANDPVNLVLVSRGENQRKSDQLPSQWLPSDKSARCWYTERLFTVAALYDLPLPETDIRAGQHSCRLVIFR